MINKLNCFFLLNLIYSNMLNNVENSSTNYLMKIKWNYLYFLTRWYKKSFLYFNFKIFYKKYYNVFQYFFFLKNNFYINQVDFNLTNMEQNEIDYKYNYFYLFYNYKYIN